MERLTLLLCLVCQTVAEYGVLHIRDSTGHLSQFCLLYNPVFETLPAKTDDLEWRNLHDVTPKGYCDKDVREWDNFGQNVIMASRGGCSFSEMACNVEAHNGSSIVLVSHPYMVVPGPNMSACGNANISVATMLKSDHEHIKSMGDGVSAQLTQFKIPTQKLDCNMIAIWFLAMFTIVTGSYWSGVTKHEQDLRKLKNITDKRMRGESDEAVDQQESTEQTSDKKTEEDSGDTMDVSFKFIVFLVVFMAGMLVLMYYFFDSIVYVFIALFCIASSAGLYSCLLPAYIRIVTATCNFHCGSKCVVEIRRIFLALFCIGIAVWWGIVRNESYAWVLQDILAVAFCINLLVSIRIPNLMGCTALLLALLIYDVFFVFITPYLTEDGGSIMVDVATGGHKGGHSSGGSGVPQVAAGGSTKPVEQLPMVFKVPRFSNTHTLCVSLSEYSLLGFGDVMIPGLLLSYVHAFDLHYNTKRIYFIATSISYGVGLSITFLALALMKKGQPALLYLVPCTLVTVFIIGCWRNDIRKLWKGLKFGTIHSSTVPPVNSGQPSRRSADEDSEEALSEGEHLLN